jgi:hypothetical protein
VFQENQLLAFKTSSDMSKFAVWMPVGLPLFPGSKAPHASSPQTNRVTTQGVGTKKGGLKMSHKKISLIAVASAIGIVISLGVISFMRLWRCGLWEGSVAVIEPVSMSTSRQSEQHPGTIPFCDC